MNNDDVDDDGAEGDDKDNGEGADDGSGVVEAGGGDVDDGGEVFDELSPLRQWLCTNFMLPAHSVSLDSNPFPGISTKSADELGDFDWK